MYIELICIKEQIDGMKDNIWWNIWTIGNTYVGIDYMWDVLAHSHCTENELIVMIL